MSNITIAYHSGYGHTKKVAETIATGMETVEGANILILDVTKVEEPINGFESGWAALEASDGILFGAPTYMGGPSGQFKTFADATSKPWFTRNWRNKVAGGFTNSGFNSGDKSSTIYYLATLAGQHEMIWVSLGVRPDGSGINRNGFHLGLGTQSENASAEETPGSEDLETAKQFGARFAEAVHRWVKGA